MQPLFEESLEDHLGRVERYMSGCELLRFPREQSSLRTELAAFIRGHVVAVVDQWIQLFAPAMSLPIERIPETQQNQHDALLRWVLQLKIPMMLRPMSISVNMHATGLFPIPRHRVSCLVR